MNFNRHSTAEGQHAFLSASKYSWLNYTEEKLALVFTNHLAALKGTRLHEFAKESIDLRIKLPKTTKTLNMYVNDAIGFKMKTEVVLYYSPNCFGTADAISFKEGMLRIHDLKTGVNKCSIQQLYIYAALFCLEYKIDPSSIEMELRIYQNDEVVVDVPDPKNIKIVMDKIVAFDIVIEKTKLRMEE